MRLAKCMEQMHQEKNLDQKALVMHSVRQRRLSMPT